MQRFTLISLDYASHLRTCNYWYLVRDQNYPHTAFHSLAGLQRWMGERGLTLSGPLPRIDTHSVQELCGTYRRHAHLDERDLRAWSGTGYPEGRTAPHTMAAWEALTPILVTRTLSNGRYTEARITCDDNGIRTVHTLNPNVRERIEYDPRESTELMDPYSHRYHITFNGCRKGATKIYHRLSDERIATDPEAAKLALYDEYEHLSNVVVSKR